MLASLVILLALMSPDPAGIVPLPLQQEDSSSVHGAWLAAWYVDETVSEPALKGLLTLHDGTLSFRADGGLYRWEIQVSDIKHVGISTTYAKTSNAIEIESLTGEKVYVVIMDGTMATASPKRVVKLMEKARTENAAATAR